MPTDIAQSIVYVLVVRYRVEVLVVLAHVVAGLHLLVESNVLGVLTSSFLI